ncbi:MAG: hypothetical protein IPK32_06260 [Verrucomicrobiaceae bacterium]|nr:hypothetical protein [Verrucomicrobiaceae bacterium]
MNFHESRTPGVLFTGFWRYKPSHGAVGALMSAAACILLGRMMLLFFRDEEVTLQKVQQAAALCFLGCLLFYFGTTLFFSFFTGYSTRLSISEDGVRYGNKFYDWRSILWIDGRLTTGAYQLYMQKRRGIFRTKRLLIDDGLSIEQWDRLQKQLKERVVPRCDHLRVGDDAHSVMPQRETPDAPAPEAADVPKS